ncbi:LytR C-terminal domain-containing protein [Nocardia asteroides]|uniref:LytR C-terminal domain-containing protein n=1 Tax=Nocardia asteroides TaxID=1824 RepID=UPI001E3044BB|nr:LytR C-terminal domain-containing protein [Nocardia asteroides]UGT64778.1 LytR C-terminal domain-containing protein [Nocardia asteroides]
MSNPNPTSGGPPLRALAMVLIALAIVFAGLGAMSLSDSDSSADAPGAETSTAAPTTTAPRATTSAAAATSTTSTVPETPTAVETTTAAPPPPPPPPTAPSVNRAVPVRVLNNSLVAGLAGRTASELGANGWSNVGTGNYAGGTLPKTTVFYGDSPAEQAAAEAIAAEIGAVAEPRFAGISGSEPGVIVIVTGN